MSSAKDVMPALYTALNGVIAYAVYDDVPKEAVQDLLDVDTRTPYVELGEIIETPFSRFGSPGAAVVPTIHGWSTYMGKKQAMEMDDAIQAELDGKILSLANGRMMRLAWESSQIVNERTEDSRVTIRHLISQYRAHVEA